VVNQTLRDIQIICVNDGSTDGSVALLEEYAAQDSRIEVIHQENQGGGSARNAAYPYIRGKYTYFVDPDDWLELELCQQCYDKAEATEADAVALRHVVHDPKPAYSRPFNPLLPKERESAEEKHDILQFAAPWRGFWRSDLLLSNNVRFSEGKRPYNDMLMFWKGIVLANRITILDIPLYHYRTRPGSYQQVIDEKHFIIIATMEEINKMLHEIGCYHSYRDVFIAQKLNVWCHRYHCLPAPMKPKFVALIREALIAEDRDFYRTASKKLIPKATKFFYEMIDGGLKEMLNYHNYQIIRPIVQMPERFVRQWIVKPIRRMLKAS